MTELHRARTSTSGRRRTSVSSTRGLRKYAGSGSACWPGTCPTTRACYLRVDMAEPRAWSAAAQEHAAIVDACVSGSIDRPPAPSLARHLARHGAHPDRPVRSPSTKPTPVREDCGGRGELP